MQWVTVKCFHFYANACFLGMTGNKLLEGMTLWFLHLVPWLNSDLCQEWFCAVYRCGIYTIGGRSWTMEQWCKRKKKKKISLWKIVFMYPHLDYLHWRVLSQWSMWLIFHKQGWCEQSCDSTLVWDWDSAAVTCLSGGESHDGGNTNTDSWNKQTHFLDLFSNWIKHILCA